MIDPTKTDIENEIAMLEEAKANLINSPTSNHRNHGMMIESTNRLLESAKLKLKQFELGEQQHAELEAAKRNV